MIVPLNPYFPHPYPATTFPKLLEAQRDRLPEGCRFAYLRLRTYHDFCLDRGAVVSTDPGAVRAIVGDCTAVIFDISDEGPGFHRNLATQLARFANLYGVPPERMIFVSTNEQFVPDLRAFTEAPRVARGLRWVWFHHHLFQLAWMAPRRHWPREGHALVDAAAARTVPFLSLNATPRAHRAMLAYLIATHPRRDAFVCSFDLSGRKATPKHTLNVIAPLAERYGLTWADMEPTLADPSRFDRTALAEMQPHELVRTLEPELYARTRLSLVTETEMTAGAIRRTTEKAFKPLLLGQPLIVFGNPGTLPLLRDFGVDTFDDTLDNSYDAVADPVDRFVAAWRLANEVLQDDAAFAVDPALADRLHANVALFDGPILERITERTMTEFAAAIA